MERQMEESSKGIYDIKIFNFQMSFVLFLIILSSLFSCYSYQAVEVELDSSLSEIVFTHGLTGGENLYLDSESMKSYFTCLDGRVVLFDGKDRYALQEVNQIQPGNSALGIVAAPSGKIYFGCCVGDWMKEGAAIWQAEMDLSHPVAITQAYPCLNGVDLGPDGALYFAAARFSMSRPKGWIYKLTAAQLNSMNPEASLTAQMCLPISPLILEPELWKEVDLCANGVFYSDLRDRLFITGTFRGVASLIPEVKELSMELEKSRMIEGFDDLCIDSKGRIIVGDQPNGFIKSYDPKTGELKRFLLEGFGVGSSCRIRKELNPDTGDLEEILYVTEFKKSALDTSFTGDCFVSLPVRLLD
jgi:hypothetical protein